MDLTDQQYYRALEAQDARFDGRFYICVTSTGIYCRPICPARTTAFKNCRFVRTAAAAEDLGYRPCLRCRPETAPGSPARQGTGATVTRALRLITGTATDGITLEHLSDRLGVSSRHLRRLFHKHLGTSPISIAQTERFAIARQLLTGTTLPINQVALASGFGSVRRFNDAVRKAFSMTPTEFRRRRQRTPVNHPGIRLSLGYRPPYAFEQLLDFLRARAIRGMEVVSDDRYRRSITVSGVAGILTVTNDGQKNRLVATFHMDGPVVIADAIQRVKDIFDLNAAPDEVAEHLARDPSIAPLVARTPGLRIPGVWDPFELSVRAIIGQQISVRGAQTILGRLVEAHGTPLTAETADQQNTPTMIFPTPGDLVDKDLTKIGLTRARARTLADLASTFAADPGFVHAAMDGATARERLLALRGIGPWTADYIALRALRNPDAFPAADLGLLKASGAASAAALEEMSNAWRPWRGYAALYLWKSL